MESEDTEEPASEGGQRRCIFCDRARPLTREHIIPRWIVEVLNELEAGYPGPVWGLHYWSGGAVEGDRQHPVSDPTVVVRQVCEVCNNGWMSLLELAVKDKLGAMIRGQSVLLEPREQLAIATWASKTAIAMEAYEPVMAVSTKDDRDLLVSQLRPPNHHRVRLGHRADVYESLMVKSAVARSTTARAEAPDAFATMFVIGWLVIHIWGGSGAPTNDEALGVGWRTSQAIMVWPPIMSDVTWPPATSLRDDELDRSLRDVLYWADDSPTLATWRQSRADLRPTDH
jgi:hypothetical protein